MNPTRSPDLPKPSRTKGKNKTLELMMTNRRLSAHEALDWGLLNQVVPDGELEDTAMGLARQFRRHNLQGGPQRHPRFELCLVN